MPQSVVFEAELFRNFLLRSTLDKYSAKRLVSTMVRINGLGKKLATASVIHDKPSLEKSLDTTGPLSKIVRSTTPEVDVSTP
jgi:hypothetical protein